MTKWIKLTYTNGYGKEIKHTCSIKGMGDLKGLCERYGIRSEYITELVVNEEVKDITKVRESLR